MNKEYIKKFQIVRIIYTLIEKYEHPVDYRKFDAIVLISLDTKDLLSVLRDLEDDIQMSLLDRGNKKKDTEYAITKKAS